MKAHIITIGDEILIGQTLNTNAAFIGEQLNLISVDVISSSVVGDSEEFILAEFQRTFEQNDIVIVTGGLGPTHDDVTRSSIVKFFDTELVEDRDVLTDIENIFKKRGREITETNKDQALVPKIAEVIRNKKGTAPGTWIEMKKKVFISLPGVPYEMKDMMKEIVIPKLLDKYSKDLTKIAKQTLIIMTTGIAESHLYEKLRDLNLVKEGTTMAFLPSQFGVKLRLTVTAPKPDEAKNKITEIEQIIRSKIGRYIYGKNEESIENVVAKSLIDRGLRLSVAESCTGGLIANRLTNFAGSSRFFERGVIAYSNAAKVELLKVDEDLIQEKGAVSLEVCLQMAEGVRAISGADIGLATTGIMGPTGGSDKKPVGTVFIGICDEKVVTAREFHFGDDRILNKERTSQAAIEMLRRNLLGIPYEE
ncbi:MAG: competence/damage-inducible protein A [Melioribacteraceae bacterium]|nr:competence/damage-inducible protein A [Melioribacteraceae bacterium]MDD3558166.1 competence/damage-inducible protein A [Melioribacteraceae bacterium]